MRIHPKPLMYIVWMSGSHHQCFTLRIRSFCTALLADVDKSTDFFNALSPCSYRASLGPQHRRSELLCCSEVPKSESLKRSH